MSARTRIVPLLTPAFLVVVLFVLIPVGWLIRISFNVNVDGAYMVPAWVLTNYTDFLSSAWNWINVIWYTIEISVTATFISVLIGYPVAMYITRCGPVQRNILLTLVLSPLLIGLVTLVYGWIVLFRGGGLLNNLMIFLGIYDKPVRYMWNMRGVMILLVYIGVPYVIISLLDSLERINPFLLEAARNIGASPWTTFWKITFPLSMPGLYAGATISFILNFAAFAVPLMVGPDQTRMMGLIVYNEALLANNLPKAAAIAIIMVIVSAIIIVGFNRLCGKFVLDRLEVEK